MCVCVLTCRFQLDSTVDLEEVLSHCPAHLTGADLYALCSDAMMAAIKRKVALIEDGEETVGLFVVSCLRVVRFDSAVYLYFGRQI